MIEKIMKAVKSNNKRRGRNITIGAVIGFLLSCTAVMGADEVKLNITLNGEKIEFNGKEYGSENSEFLDNTFENGIYTNNMIISAESSTDNVYGIKLEKASNSINLIASQSPISLINNGTISVENNVENNNMVKQAYGIYNGIELTNLINNGIISVVNKEKAAYGIYNRVGLMNLVNNGEINVKGGSTNTDTAGILTENESIKVIKNNGYIKSSRNGILISSEAEEILNAGLIYGVIGISSSSSNGGKVINKGRIAVDSNSGTVIKVMYNEGIKELENIGTLSGKGIFDLSSGGRINKADNYGLIIGDKLTVNGSISNGLKNYGLAVKFNESDGTYEILTENTETPSESTYTVKNIELKDGKQLESFYLSGEKNDSYVYNGLENTLIVAEKNNELVNSVVNAHKTALVLKGNETELVLDKTQINGGIDGESSTVTLEGDWNNLNAKNESVINGDINSTGNFTTISFENNSVVNGKIELEGKWNTLTIDDSTVNGEIIALGSKNTLNLYGKSNLAKSGIENSLNINHNISGFGRIQIKNNVVFSEDIKVSSAERINILDGGVLSLGLNASGANITHALNGNTGLLISGENKNGTLKFLVGNLSENEVNINMEGITLENVNLKTSNVIYKIGDIEVDSIQVVKNNGLDEILSGEGATLDQYNIPANTSYNSLNNIYKSAILNKNNMGSLIEIIDSSTGEEQIAKLLSYLGNIYTGTPYSVSSELSRRSAGMFRDIVTENQFRPDLNRWLVMGGLTHTDGGTKDSYYGQNYHGFDTGTADVDTDMKLTGAYALGKYGYSENVSLGVTVGGNRSEAKLPMSKVKGNSGYIGAFAENYRGNLTLKAGAGIQYSEYDANRATLGGHSYSDKYSDMTYDIYLNGRYSNPMGDNFFLEPYGTLSYTYVDQEGADEGSKVLAIETDSKSFDYTAAKVGVDLKKVIPHEKGKSTLSAGVSYTRLLNGADKDNITGRFKGKDASDFDILVAHKNENSIGLNAKYTLELESGILFDVKGSYSVERDSHNGTGKNRNKGEWIVGTGLGYKF